MLKQSSLPTLQALLSLPPFLHSPFEPQHFHDGPVWQDVGESYQLKMVVAGVAPELLHLEVLNSKLQLSIFPEKEEAPAGINEETTPLPSRVISWSLSDQLDTENITSELSRGVLTVTIPKLKPKESRIISITEKGE